MMIIIIGTDGQIIKSPKTVTNSFSWNELPVNHDHVYCCRLIEWGQLLEGSLFLGDKLPVEPYSIMF